MPTIVHADIFFLVTTICVVVVAVLFVIAWIYMMSILGEIRRFLDKAVAEGQLLMEELGEMRRGMRKKRRLFWILRLIRSIAFR